MKRLALGIWLFWGCLFTMPVAAQELYGGDSAVVTEQAVEPESAEPQHVEPEYLPDQSHQDYLDRQAREERALYPKGGTSSWDTDKLNRTYSAEENNEAEQNATKTSESNFLYDLLQNGFIKYGLMVLVIVLIGLFLYYLIRNTTSNARLQAISDSGSHEIVDEETGITGNFMEQARKAEAEGRWNDAIRFRFLGNLEQLQHSGWIAYRKYKTNDTYREELKPHEADVGFGQMARWFERVKYGDWTVTAEHYQRVIPDFHAFENTLNRTGHA